MTVAHVLPVLIQSLCFIFVVKVEVLTLLAMAAAAFIGAYLGTHITKTGMLQLSNESLVVF